MEVEASWMGLVPLCKGVVFLPYDVQVEDNHLETRKRALSRHGICQCLGLGLPRL